VNVTQSVLDAVGGLDVCGEHISTTSNLDSPYLGGLGLGSALEGLCVRVQSTSLRQLYRQLVATALNCAISSGTTCDEIVLRYIDFDFSACNSVCEGGVQPAGAPTVSQCIEQLDCFNNGGQMIDGTCTLGLPNNCHEAVLCNESLGICPKNTPATSSAACNEATQNRCTIDACN